MSLKMYTTINDIKGEKRSDLAYPVQNFDSSKEVTVVRMLSDNIQYKMTKPLGLKLQQKTNITWILYKKRIRCNCRKKTQTYRFEQ